MLSKTRAKFWNSALHFILWCFCALSLNAYEAWERIADKGVPSSRNCHGVLWTGTEMAVWGGYDPKSHPLNSGALYNPSTKTWRPMSMLDAPWPRAFPILAWTGTEIIVCGGWSSDGGRYNPQTDQWTPMETPYISAAAMFVWTGEKLLIWNPESISTAVGYIFDPANGSWSSMNPAGGPIINGGGANITTVWTGKEMMVWGCTNVGSFSIGGPIGARYNLERNEWLSISIVNAPSIRSGHHAVWTGHEMIVWGGDVDHTYLNDGARYDPVTDTWTPMNGANAPRPRANGPCVWTGVEFVVWGGHGDFTEGTGGAYNPATDSWRPIQPIFDLPSGGLPVWTGTDMIVWGGLDDGARYNPAQDQWSSLETNVPPHFITPPTTVWTGTELLVLGRQPWGFNPLTEEWRQLSTNGAPPLASDSLAVWTGEEMIVWGKAWDPDADSGLGSFGGRYDPATDRWRPISTNNAPVGMLGHSAVWTGSQLLMWAGSLKATPCCSGRIYDPRTDTWEIMPNDGAPSTRGQHTVIWTGKEMIVWGGTINPQYFNDGAAYNPLTKTWRPVTTNNAPSARCCHFAVWTGKEMLIGGGRFGLNERNFADARYNPETDRWAPISGTGAPLWGNQESVIWAGKELWVWGGGSPYQQPPFYGGAYNPESNTWRAIAPPTDEPRRVSAVTAWTGKEMITFGGVTMDYSIPLDRKTWSYAPEPVMNIEIAETHVATVSWLRKFDAMILESSDGINGGGWNRLVSPQLVGREKRQTVTDDSPKFYRLRQ